MPAPRPPDASPRFSVDTHLFRELGALLVGRDSTALVELIKNTYDADASCVTIIGEGLADGTGRITITDDGVGMTLTEFEKGFLRIASRTKEEGDRRSVRYRRRYTGAKGVGRLSAHKLAAKITVDSIPDLNAKGLGDQPGVRATIDWDIVETHTTLEEVTSGIKVQPVPADGRTPGTTIVLDRLRRRWTTRALSTFLAELEAFRPPPLLTGHLAESLAAGPFLFDRPRTTSTPSRHQPDPGFRVTTSGDFATGVDFWDRVATRANWLIEVKARREGVVVLVMPTAKGPTKGRTGAQRFNWPHPERQSGPFFDARILVREGVIGRSGDPIADFARRVAGVRVFMEGFRVLPYGGPGDDWLELDRDYTRRIRELDIPKSLRDDADDTTESFRILGNQAYYGAVFLTAEQSPNLEMVVSREGFIPNDAFWALRDIVRASVDLSTRVRAATAAQNSSTTGHNDASTSSGSGERDATSQSPTAETVAALILQARNTAKTFENSPGASSPHTLLELQNTLAAAQEGLEAILSVQSMLRILASVGQQLAEFVHETNGMLALARQVASLISSDNGRPTAASLRAATESAERLVGLIDRQSSYLVEVLGVDSQRRRTRRALARSAQAAAQLVAARSEDRGIRLAVQVPQNLDTTPMFAAELTSVFSNLLTNAVKAAGHEGAIAVTAHYDGPTVVVRVENTGVGVDLDEAERWFKPFQSTTAAADPVLGQGMGLGLTIVRDILAEYNGSVRFVEPSDAYSTAVEVRIPRKER
jgi:signal transduction histidine kinase